MLAALLIAAAACVAFTNGANANSKGVASLYGSGSASLRVTLWWGTAATFAGSLAALYLASGMLQTFGGRGLVPDALANSPKFALAAAIGAAATSFLATRFAFPVSTTHALLGGLLGAGLASGDHHVNLGPLGRSFVQPLVISPLLAIALGALFHLLLNRTRLLPLERTRTLDVLHFLSGGATSFARGLNDTPKMAALLLAGGTLQPRQSILLVAACIALGGLVDAGRVAETLALKITGMNAREGFAANLATALLATTASLNSLPVSTTHVSVGALTGIGLATGKVHWRSVSQIVLAWIVTLPCGAAMAAVAIWLLH